MRGWRRGLWWLPFGMLKGRRVPTEAVRAEHRMEDLLAHDPLLEEFHRLRLFTPDELEDRNMWNKRLS